MAFLPSEVHYKKIHHLLVPLQRHNQAIIINIVSTYGNVRQNLGIIKDQNIVATI